MVDDNRLEGPVGWLPWTVLAGGCLIAFCVDQFIFHRGTRTVSVARGTAVTITWIVVAVGAGGAVAGAYGLEFGIYFWDGLLMEYILSIDNLVLFHFILKAFQVPLGEQHKAVAYGLLGAVVMRLGFFFLGREIIDSLHVVSIVFGAILILTGIFTLFSSDEPSDTRNLLVVRLIMKTKRVWPSYESGKLFVKKDKNQVPVAPSSVVSTGTTSPVTEGALSVAGVAEREKELEDDNGGRPAAATGTTQDLVWKATLLVVVVAAMETTDAIFAVDSTAAKLGVIPNIFIAYSSTVAGLFGIRSAVSLTEHLVSGFWLFRYGLSLIMIVVGVKVSMQFYIHIPAWYFLIFVIAVCLICVLGSVVLTRRERRRLNKERPTDAAPLIAHEREP